MCSIEFQQLKENIAYTRKKIKKHSDKLRALLDQCPHEETEKSSEYFEGTYFDRAYTTHYEKCTVCGDIIHSYVVAHDWYG